MAREVQLWCIFLDNGPNQPFPVTIGLDQMVRDLKKIITSKRCMREYNARDMLLYKLSEPIPIRPTKDLFRRIENKGDIHSFAVEVEETSDTLSHVFIDGVADSAVHFLVKLPPGEEKPRPRKRTRIDHDLPKKSEADLQLHCLVLSNDDPEPRSFVVRIPGNYYVSELKEVIKARAAPQLNNVFAPTLRLWKCAIPIGQEVIESIRLDGTDRRLSRITGDCRLSELWSEDLPSNTLHILAQAPEESPGPLADQENLPPRKRSCIDHDLPKKGEAGFLSTITPSGSNESKVSISTHRSGKPRLLHAGEVKREHEMMYLLYDALWKKGEETWTEISHIVKEHVPDPFVTPGRAEECDLDPPEEDQITIVDLTSLLSWTAKDVKLDVLTPVVLVRDEYTKLDNFMESNSEHVLLLGQPGIGKTVYLTYCLLRRLLAGLPTIFAKTSDIRYIFLDSGVYWIPFNSFRVSEDPPFTDRVDNTLVLFDLNEEQSTPERFLHWRILASSSPQPGRCKEWVKHRGVEYWVMRRSGTPGIPHPQLASQLERP